MQKHWRDQTWLMRYGDPSNFSLDMVLSAVSLCSQVIAGALLTLGLYFVFGSYHLGVFTQLYAFFVIAGQLFVFGLNDSVLKHSAEYRENQSEITYIFVTATTSALFFAVMGGLVIHIFAAKLGSKFYGTTVTQGLFWLAPGIAFFVLNKVSVALLNGQQRFGRFSLIQATRAVLLTSLILGCSYIGKPVSWMGLCFTLVEIILFIFQLDIYILNFSEIIKKQGALAKFKSWLRAHFSFGFLSMPHGFLSETFIRVDILTLAVFVSDEKVGLYGLAAFFVEGVYQISIIVRNVCNPRLVKIVAQENFEWLVDIVKRSAMLSFIGTALAVALVLFFFWSLAYFVDIDEFDTLWVLMLVLFFGLTVHSIVVPFDCIFIQAGRPGVQSVYFGMLSLINLVSNILLIPALGLVGAAVATAFSMSISLFTLSIFSYFTLKISRW